VYHVEGWLEYADHNLVKNLVNCSIPLLRAGGDHEKIILSPLPRYMKPCCREKGHVSNRKEADYFAKMGDDMRDIKDSIKDLVYGKKIRAFKVLEPMTLLEEEEGDLVTATKLKEYFSEDPVHLSSDGYHDILQCLLNQILEGTFTRPQTPKQKSSGIPARDQSKLRGAWVNQDDTVAHRNYSDSRNRARGQFGGGGSRGSSGGWKRDAGGNYGRGGGGTSGGARGGARGGVRGGGSKSWKSGWRGKNRSYPY
jgi:hypothetical protein